jgi:hypothetical protein
MIDIIFQFASEYVLVRVKDNQLYFMTQNFGSQWATIDGLKFNKQGTIKEYPDLESNSEWQTIAIQRLKDKIKAMNTEGEITDYIINDLRKHGYIPKYKQRVGFRREVIQ